MVTFYSQLVNYYYWTWYWQY